MKYPLGIQSFEKIRNDGYLYIDKTAYVYKLASSGSYYFLSRPRRFGKSLLVSTLEAFFQGKRKLFDGLAIDGLEKEWRQYPVLHLDLNAEKYTTPEALDHILNAHLSLWEEKYGRRAGETTLSNRFAGVIRRAYEQTGEKVVILVDEYDKPLLQAIKDKTLQEDYRATLKAFYGVEKSMDDYIQFAFFTGVTKFSKVSVFSDLNNLTDITMDLRYAEICGITEEELRTNLDEQVGLMAEKLRMTKADCYKQLKSYYDGYHFEADAVGVYNPYSLLRALDSMTFKDFWFETGTPSFLVELLKQNNYLLENLNHEQLTADVLGNVDTIDQTPIPLLYQSGYLTVKGVEQEFSLYKLGFPNEEVERSFARFLLPYYTPLQPTQGQLFVANFVKDVRTGRAEQFVQRLDTLFAGGDYQVAGDAELYFQNAVWVIFKMIGFYTEVERHTANGRMDMLIKAQDYIYILEFKLDKTAEEALQQIEEREYAKPFEHDGRHIYKIGINFSTRTRRIDGWKISE